MERKVEVSKGANVEAEDVRYEVDRDMQEVTAKYRLSGIDCETLLWASERGTELIVAYTSQPLEDRPFTAENLHTLRAAGCIPKDMSDTQALEVIASSQTQPNDVEELLGIQPFMGRILTEAERLFRQALDRENSVFLDRD